MPRKNTRPAATSTVQLGLARALGDGSIAKPEVFLLAPEKLQGRIKQPDPIRYPKDRWQDFVQSIQERGLDNPILVRPATEGEGEYAIAEGRHRELALETLRFTQIPCLLRADYTEGDAALAEVVTNTQRSATGNPFTEALAMRRAMEKDNLTADDVARKVGRSVSWVNERLRLLRISDAGGEALARRVGGDFDVDDLKPVFQLLELPKDTPNRDAVLQAGMTAACSAKRSYDLRQAVEGAVIKATGGVSIGAPFIDYHVEYDPTFKKAVSRLPGITIGHQRIVFDKDAATEARDKARDRLKVKPSGRGGGSRRDNTDELVLRRLGRIEIDLVAKHAKSKVSYGKDFEKVLILEWLRNLGQIGARNVDRELMKVVAGIDKWDGRGESLVSHVEKAWGKVEAGRIMHVALFLQKDRRQTYMTGKGVPDPYAQLLVGKGNAALLAQAKREVAAEQKEKAAKEKAKPGKKGKAAKAKKGRPAASASDEDLADGQGIEGSNDALPNEDGNEE
jgi:ParB/RepB/Spo0J family partition protein